MSISDIEVKQEEKIRSRFNQRVLDLKAAHGIKGADTTADLVDKLHHRVHERNLLVHDYGLICSELNKVRSVETTRTPAEERFVERFKYEWKIKLYPQTWVGNLCLDYFTPALGAFNSDFVRGYALKGLAFEIDGKVHETEMKMKKDDHKTKSLMDLGLAVWRLTNEQVYQGKALPPRREIIQQFGKLCSRERARIWSRIYLMTILYHAPFGMVSYYFPKIKTVSSEGEVS